MKLFLGGSGDFLIISPTGPIILKQNTKLLFSGSTKETFRVTSIRLNDLPLEERFQTPLENTILTFEPNSNVDEIMLTGDIKLKCNQLTSTTKINVSGCCSLHLPTKSHFEKLEIKMSENSKINGHDATVDFFSCSMSNISKCKSLIVTQRSNITLDGGKCFLQLRKFVNSQFNFDMKNGGGKYDITDIIRFVPGVPLLDQHLS